MTAPAVSRTVLFQPANDDAELRVSWAPLAAIITKLIDQHTVNVVVFGPGGSTYGRQNVIYRHGDEDDLVPANRAFCMSQTDAPPAAGTDLKAEAKS